MNETFKARSLFNCYLVDEMELSHQYDPIWRNNAMSCKVILILQQMFHFNISFITSKLDTSVTNDKGVNTYLGPNDSFDLCVEPSPITTDLLNDFNPVEAMFVWRFGFILRRKYNGIMRPYYSLPFSKSVWCCLFSMVILASFIFYVIRRWERTIVGYLECRFIYEFYAAIGVVCQHSLPTSSILWSRRMAYFFFVVFAYVTHSFYTSNLLSHIVTDKNGRMNLKSLIESDYELNIVENMKIFAEKRVNNTFERKMNMIEKKLSRTKVINIFDGLEAVRTTKTALLCDYPGAYSIIAKTFENEEICEVKEVDVFSNVKMYFFAAKKFRYIEKLKIGTLRMKESGIMKRIIAKNDYTPLSCTINAFHRNAQFDHILSPLIIMLVAYVLVCAILVAERVHNERNKVWPYTE